MTSIFLSSCSKNCPIPEAQEEWLFVHTAESAKILNTTTIVMPLADDIFAFTDRPYRKSYHMTGRHYADLWTHQGENCFQDDPPNAVLTWVDGDEEKSIEVVITHAILNSSMITYTIWDDSGIITEDIVHPSLFVDGANSEVKIGDTYAGGLVFWLDGNGGGLIAAPSDQSGAAEWGCYGTIMGANGTAIGTGYQNTIDIVNANCSPYFSGNSIAADICANLTLGGYSDWFLPSKDELNEMYSNIGQGNALGLGNVGGFADSDSDYMSSTEIDAYNAWCQYFNNNGLQDYHDKIMTTYVRAVRAF